MDRREKLRAKLKAKLDARQAGKETSAKEVAKKTLVTKDGVTITKPSSYTDEEAQSIFELEQNTKISGDQLAYLLSKCATKLQSNQKAFSTITTKVLKNVVNRYAEDGSDFNALQDVMTLIEYNPPMKVNCGGKVFALDEIFHSYLTTKFVLDKEEAMPNGLLKVESYIISYVGKCKLMKDSNYFTQEGKIKPGVTRAQMEKELAGSDEDIDHLFANPFSLIPEEWGPKASDQDPIYEMDKETEQILGKAPALKDHIEKTTKDRFKKCHEGWMKQLYTQKQAGDTKGSKVTELLIKSLEAFAEPYIKDCDSTLKTMGESTSPNDTDGGDA